MTILLLHVNTYIITAVFLYSFQLVLALLLFKRQVRLNGFDFSATASCLDATVLHSHEMMGLERSKYVSLNVT